MTPDGITKLTGEPSQIAALHRRNLADMEFIDDEQVSTTDENGDKIAETTVAGPGGTTQTLELNLTKLYQPAISTTGDIELLRLEAELVAEGRDLANPHVPINVDVLASARERIEQDGLTPAWEVVE